MNHKYTILYAEDEEHIRKRYIPFLQDYFKEVYEASNGKEAYDIYLEKKPDILILDINMPIIDGLKLSQKIREKDESTKIIILSALSDTNILILACSLYLFDYLLKPVRTIQFVATLKKVISELDKNSNINLFHISDNIKFDIKAHLLFDNNKIVKLTKNEIKLLSLLIINIKNKISYDDILNYIWEDDIYNTSYTYNKLRILVSRLNKKLSKDIIISNYGLGYQFIL